MPFGPVTFWAGKQSYSLFNNVSSSAKCDVNVKWGGGLFCKCLTEKNVKVDVGYVKAIK